MTFNRHVSSSGVVWSFGESKARIAWASALVMNSRIRVPKRTWKAFLKVWKPLGRSGKIKLAVRMQQFVACNPTIPEDAATALFMSSAGKGLNR